MKVTVKNIEFSDKSWKRRYAGQTIEVISSKPSIVDGVPMYIAMELPGVFAGWIKVSECDIVEEVNL